jgi:hypothetical protein
MLWYKGWLETRFRLLFVLSISGLVLVMLHSGGLKGPAALLALLQGTTMFVALFPAMLAGAGIATQPSFQATRGIHGSMLFTLSLPVSRRRLLAVRASLGWLEIVGGIGILNCGMWVLFPLLREATTPEEMFKYSIVLMVCASAFYSISVLLATFLDDLWRVWGSMLTFGAIWWLSTNTPLPPSANIFRAMVKDSPLLAHTMPWTAMAVSLGLAAILFFAALKIVKTREY